MLISTICKFFSKNLDKYKYFICKKQGICKYIKPIEEVCLTHQNEWRIWGFLG